MGARGLELIVGARGDPEWGPLILVGFGGVQAEILQDVRLLAPDLTKAAIVAELGKLKSAALLHGFRGSPPLDVAAVMAGGYPVEAVLGGTVASALLVYHDWRACGPISASRSRSRRSGRCAGWRRSRRGGPACGMPIARGLSASRCCARTISTIISARSRPPRIASI